MGDAVRPQPAPRKSPSKTQQNTVLNVSIPSQDRTLETPDQKINGKTGFCMIQFSKISVFPDSLIARFDKMTPTRKDELSPSTSDFDTFKATLNKVLAMKLMNEMNISAWNFSGR